MKSDFIKQIEERDEKLYGERCTRCEQYNTYCRCTELDNFSFNKFYEPSPKFKFYFSINNNTRQEFAESSDLRIHLKPEDDSKGVLLEFTDISGNTFEISAEKTI